MHIKRTLRLIALIFLIIIASIIPLPIPIQFHHKDELPQNLIEMVDRKEDENEEENQAEIS